MLSLSLDQIWSTSSTVRVGHPFNFDYGDCCSYLKKILLRNIQVKTEAYLRFLFMNKKRTRMVLR